MTGTDYPRVDAIVRRECSCLSGSVRNDDGSYDETTVEGDADCVVHGCSHYAKHSEHAKQVNAEIAEADRLDRGVR